MAAETQVAPKRVVDIVATAVLVLLGAGLGLFWGFLALVFTPSGTNAAVWWVVVAIAMMIVPVITAVAGFRRAVKGSMGFWVPLVGLGILAALVGLQTLISATLG